MVKYKYILHVVQFMSGNNPDNDPAESRRSFLRFAAATGLLAGTGGVGVARLTGETTASISYQEQHEGYFSSYGDLIDTSYTSGSNVEPYALTNEAETGTRTVSDEGHNWTPTTSEPTTTASCSGGIGTEGHCWTPTTSEPTPTPTPSPTPTSTPKPNDGPVASISTDLHVAVDASTSFSGSSSYDSDGYISSYNWDFGDGATATGESVSHTYTDTGSYTVSLTVTDNDGASDSTSTTVTVGNQWQVNLEFQDGTTIAERGLEIGDGIWEAFSDGERFVCEMTQDVKDAVDSFLAGSLGDADSQFQYPAVKSPKSIDMTSGSIHTIESNEVNVGDAWVGGVLPDWAIPNIPVLERAYADWESGLAEAAAKGTNGAAYAMSAVCAEFTPSASTPTSGYVTINYDWSAHIWVFAGSASMTVSPFVRNVTEGEEEMINDINFAKDFFSFDLDGNIQIPSIWYDDGTESYTFAMTDNNERDLRFKDGNQYQVGLKLLVNTAVYDLYPVTAGGVLSVDQTTNHVNPIGDKSIRDSSPSGLEDTLQNGVSINSIDVEW